MLCSGAIFVCIVFSVSLCLCGSNSGEAKLTASRFVVGIDLGTTNCALAYFDTGLGEVPPLAHLPIPQVVTPGNVEERPLLPSFLYLPGPSEQPAGALKLPWDAGRDYAVGEFAR